MPTPKSIPNIHDENLQLAKLYYQNLLTQLNHKQIIFQRDLISLLKENIQPPEKYKKVMFHMNELIQSSPEVSENIMNNFEIYY